ncbi:BTAD domain-containing putative transcriptional regulator [Kribbella sp. NPDC051718]|uniref:AfsR/SARP family transcriptional regulator n=1 Tax=Kribbella sp. NPDC051718 TaxID=3155168 RepID=UPI00342C6521
MEFRLFGGVDVLSDGRLLDAGSPRQRLVLAALLVDPGRAVTIETLIDRVWDDDPPPAARNVLYAHLSRIRRLLGPAVKVERRHPGYQLGIDPDQVDLHRFWQLADQANNPEYRAQDRASQLAKALGLWQGTPLANLPGAWAAQVRDRWDRRRVDAIVQWAESELRLGNTATVIAELPELIAVYPLVEPLEALLMRALHTAGRPAEALDRYALVQRRLVEELGADPGIELSEVHRSILRGELPVQPAGRLAVPAQLPPATFGFTGRVSHLRRLDSVLANGGQSIAVVSGTAGVGKTALALHWAHQARDRFPDGQIYLNLRGFDPGGTPVSPAEAVRTLLDAFAVEPERIPGGLEAQVGLYRSLVADRRVLIVLDNVADADQARPLLPGARECRVVVTSRNQLRGLLTADGAQPVTLDLLSISEARSLLAQRLGAERVSAEPAAVNEIITHCARLPLALSIVAARAVSYPEFSLQVLAGELGAGLDEFAGADNATDVRVVFSWSYLRLSPDAARLFRLLGLHSGPDIGLPAAVSLAAEAPRQVRRLLGELCAAHLLTEHAPGRYAFHDLLRAYAAELALAEHPEAERLEVSRRILDHYVHTGYLADGLLNTRRDDDPTVLSPVAPGVVPECPSSYDEGLGWFTTELPVLLSIVRTATDPWQLVWTMTRFLAYRGLWQESLAALGIAVAAAERSGDQARQAFAYRYLGCAQIRLGQYDDAGVQLQAALDRYLASGDTVGAAHTHRHFAWMLDRQAAHAEALEHAELALELFESAGHRAGQARSLNAVGWFHAMLGDHLEALRNCELALELQASLADRFGQAETLDSLGYIQQRLGRFTDAIESYERAVALFQAVGDRYNEADTLGSLGDVHQAAGDDGAARIAWARAVDVLERLGHPDADALRARLTL